MATASRTNKQQTGLKDLPRQIGQTVEASMTKPPSRTETALDVALIGATLLEVVNPPIALAGIALNRIAHVLR